MATRAMRLPPGWYPGTEAGLRESLARWSSPGKGAAVGGAPGETRASGRAVAALAPHAGWTYSGRLAAAALAALGPAPTLIVVGGHLPAGHPLLMAEEDSFATPAGRLEADAELAVLLSRELSPGPDRAADNTVEVLLPLLALRSPRPRILWLRAPNELSSLALGGRIEALCAAIGREAVLLASSDLTHYGPGYGFAPAGRGPRAATWVREVNDKGFIDALLSGEAEEALRRGVEEGAACSSGAAMVALGFARARAAREGRRVEARLLGYATSAEIRPAEDFVGYAAVAWEPA